MCSNADPTALLSTWGSIDGIECGLFLIHAPLGQTTLLVGQVWDDERKGEGESQCWLIAYSSRKAQRRPPGLTSPSDGQIAINSIICLQHIHCGRVWNLIQASDVQYTDSKMYISAPRLKLENENLWPHQGSNPGPAKSEADMLPSEQIFTCWIHISETSGSIKLKFCMLSIFKIQQNSVPVSLSHLIHLNHN